MEAQACQMRRGIAGVAEGPCPNKGVVPHLSPPREDAKGSGWSGEEEDASSCYSGSHLREVYLAEREKIIPGLGRLEVQPEGMEW